MPPDEKLDENLMSLLSKDRQVLVDLAHVDGEAAEMLARGVSGYAMLRSFYSTRDANTSNGPLARRRIAAKTLLAVIESASDCIKGGLFDPEIESAVPVEGLLNLLGEVLPLLGQNSEAGKPMHVLENKHLLTLMAILEDFEQVSARIREGGEGLLRASMGCFRNDGMTSSAHLKKSTSGLSASEFLSGSGSSWEQLAESSWSLLQSTEDFGKTRSKGKGHVKLAEVNRGWDWRRGLDAVATSPDIGSKEVVLMSRTALAKEMGRAWAGGWE
jgi:hypothetical protein